MKWLLNKLACRIGWHYWSWPLNLNSPLFLDDPIPNEAMCRHCQVLYGGKARYHHTNH